jgi:hypothetical protein
MWIKIYKTERLVDKVMEAVFRFSQVFLVYSHSCPQSLAVLRIWKPESLRIYSYTK